MKKKYSNRKVDSAPKKKAQRQPSTVTVKIIGRCHPYAYALGGVYTISNKEYKKLDELGAVEKVG